MELTAGAIAEVTGGTVTAGSPSTVASAFTIDSRLAAAGACFFALQGERDGHDFVDDAFARGASVAVVARHVTTRASGSTVTVADALRALQELGGHARAQLASAVVVGITGSAGKTATKDLTAAAFRPTRRVHASPGSYNNESGLPLTLLGASDDTEVVVTEMGARFAGNIRELCDIARPSVGVITHVGMAHAEHLGGREGIARVKGELLEALPATGLAVLNAACDATPGLIARTSARVLVVGRESGVDVRIDDVRLDDELRPHFTIATPWGRAGIDLTMRGEHQVENAAMAATVALAFDVPIDSVVAGLRDARTAALRMEIVHTAGGVTLINDAYNSSPTSAAAAVRSLARLPVAGRRIAVLGAMLELGAHAETEHAALGALAASAGIDVLIAVGGPAESMADGARRAAPGQIAIRAVPDAAAATAALSEEVHAGDGVLVKASRAIGLERVADEVARGRRQ
ncbi:MAG TPA: UDP-N-acetylmuramoyl-tripeptide--D-alanyl-D-alanine ligase [Acidimicrobiia bacterium]